MEPPVGEFDGEYRFLSNFYPSPLEVDGITYPTVEHAYQAMKSADPHVRQRIAQQRSPQDAKRMGRSVDLRPDWEETKIGIMRDLVRMKFNDRELAAKLLETGDAELIEGNWWGDTFWGVNERTGEGENHLGRILMEIRSEL